MPQATNFKEEIESMKNDAIDAVQQGRTDFTKKLKRTAHNWLEYKDGKQKLVKAGTAVAITTVFVGVGAATHTVGIPVVVALAVGGFVVGKMYDAAWTKGVGRQYTGIKNTEAFVQGMPEDLDTVEVSKELASRAHKTVRRACQHYRTAVEKWQELPDLDLFRGAAVPGCDDAWDLVMAMLSAKRHFKKSRLYLHPALYLSHALLNVYKDNRDLFARTGDDWLTTVLKNLMTLHQNAGEHGSPCGGDYCYWDAGRIRGLGPSQLNAAALGKLWDDGEIGRLEADLAEADNHLLKDLAKPLPFTRPDSRALYKDAVGKFNNRSDLITMKHSVTNWGNRKTTGEKVTFGISQVGSVVTSAASAGVGAHVPSEAVVILLEYGKDAVDSGLDGLVDTALEAKAKSGTTQAGTGTGGQKTGKEGQESLQMAAIHLFGVIQANEEMTEFEKDFKSLTVENDACGAFSKWLYQYYKMRHHLFKAQKFLKETIEIEALLSEELSRKFEALRVYHGKAIREIDILMGANRHGLCPQDQCYCGRT
jgi:hypothetical protein